MGVGLSLPRNVKCARLPAIIRHWLDDALKVFRLWAKLQLRSCRNGSCAAEP